MEDVTFDIYGEIPELYKLTKPFLKSHRVFSGSGSWSIHRFKLEIENHLIDENWDWDVP